MLKYHYQVRLNCTKYFVDLCIGYILYICSGTHPPTDYHNSLLELYARYGKIFKKTINGETTLHLFDPDYIEAVYRTADKLPYILPLLKTTQMYRKYRGMSPGLGNT